MKEIVYFIHPQNTLSQGCLVLDLVESFAKGHETEFHFPQEGYSIAKWRSMLKGSLETELFTFLLQETFSFAPGRMGRQSEHLILKQLKIHPEKVEEAFKRIAPLQKLFFQGNRLVIDVLGKAEFYYSGTSEEKGVLRIEGRVKWRDRDIDLAGCEAVGCGRPFHWFVKGLTLKFIQTHVTWKMLHSMKSGAISLDGEAKANFLDNLDPSDAELPVLVMQEGVLESTALPAPYPLLRLHDRWGACANLWMDYGAGYTICFAEKENFIKNSQGAPVVKRLIDIESGWEKDLLETGYIKKWIGTSHYYCPLDAVGKSLAFLLEIGWKIEDANGRQLIHQTALQLDFQEEKEILSVKGTVSYDTYQADLSKIVGAFNRKERFIELSPTTVGLLPFGNEQKDLLEIAEEGEWVGSALKMRKARFGSLDPLLKYAANSTPLLGVKERLARFEGIKTAPPASCFQGTLRPYQQLGVDWLAFLEEFGFHGLLADEMGLGKTVQVLAFLSRFPKGKPHLVVMPTSLVFNWKNEIAVFLPSWDCLCYRGSDRERNGDRIKQADVVLISYATLRLDIEWLREIEWQTIILDEAQTIKNAATKTAQAVYLLKGSFRLSITGTPVENHLHELWSHFRFLIPDLLGTQEEFRAEVEASQLDRRHLERIKRKTAPFFLRRLKKEVAADLPPRTNQTVWIELPPEQREAYDRLVAGFKSGLMKKVELDGMGKHRLEVLEAILRLRQMCCHPLLVPSSLDSIASCGASAKFDYLLQDLETLFLEKNKVLIYSQFTSMLHLMKQAAKEREWPFVSLDGTTQNREEVVTRFQTDPDQFLFFISLKAGGVGLNLTAADYVYLYDPWWNEAAEEQAIHRAHRIGRKDPIVAKRLVTLETIEEKMMKLKASKKEMVEALFEGEASAAQLTLDDFAFLLT